MAAIVANLVARTALAEHLLAARGLLRVRRREAARDE
jgi:hypothetical protein